MLYGEVCCEISCGDVTEREGKVYLSEWRLRFI